jgi:hydrogenase maturation factor
MQSNSGENSCSIIEQGHCITCSDEALSAKILEIEPATAIALVLLGTETLEIDISLIEDIVAGDWVLIHGGVALARLEATEHE